MATVGTLDRNRLLTGKDNPTRKEIRDSVLSRASSGQPAVDLKSPFEATIAAGDQTVPTSQHPFKKQIVDGLLSKATPIPRGDFPKIAKGRDFDFDSVLADPEFRQEALGIMALQERGVPAHFAGRLPVDGSNLGLGGDAGLLLKSREHPTFFKSMLRDAKLGGEFHTSPSGRVLSTVEPATMLVNDALQRNIKKDFVQRIIDPLSVPPLQNEDGTSSTHSMMSAGVDGRQIALPTVVNVGGELVRLSEDEAIRHALNTGEFIEFNSQEEADAFATQYKLAFPNGDR